MSKNANFFGPTSGRLSTNNLNAATLGSGQARYSALFPAAWTDYYGSQFTVKARVKQFSPILPHDYQRTSYPVGVYLWELSNPTDTPCEVAVMLSWNNAFGGVPGGKGDRRGPGRYGQGQHLPGLV